VVEGTGLENRRTRKGIVGSNPTLPVITLQRNRLLRRDFIEKSRLRFVPRICPTGCQQIILIALSIPR
jgi:hypothetical protein